MALKRFIAGAVCQQCGAQDKVRAKDESEKVMRRECVHAAIMTCNTSGPEKTGWLYGQLYRSSVR